MFNIDIYQYLWRSILHTALESVNTLPSQPSSCCCPPLLTAHLTSDELTRIASIFRVLGEPARLQLLNLIAAQPSQEVRACELVETLGLSQPTVSHHLKVMYEAGLLTKDRRGTWIYYRVVTDRLSELRSVFA